MNNFKANLKDNLTNICKWVIAAVGFIIGLPVALHDQFGVNIVLPSWVNLIGGILFLAAVFIMAQMTGKNADGSAKTPFQIEQQNKDKDNPPPIG